MADTINTGGIQVMGGSMDRSCLWGRGGTCDGMHLYDQEYWESFPLNGSDPVMSSDPTSSHVFFLLVEMML